MPVETIISVIPLLLMLAALGMMLHIQDGEKAWWKTVLLILGVFLVVHAGFSLLPVETIWPAVLVLAIVTLIGLTIRNILQKEISWMEFILKLSPIFVTVAGLIVLPRESARNLTYLVIVFPAVILALRSLLSYLRARRSFTRWLEPDYATPRSIR
jgi:hypothetical protein